MAVIEPKQVQKAFFGLGARGGGRAQRRAPAHLPGYTDVLNADLAPRIEHHGVEANQLLHKGFPLLGGARQVIAPLLKRAQYRWIIACASGATALGVVGGCEMM